MINLTLIDLLLLCISIVFLMIFLFIFFNKGKQKNNILTALQNSHAVLKDQYVQDEDALKTALGSMLTEELATKVTEIISIEKETYKSLAMLFINYQPAAIEMMPSTIKRLITAYTQFLQQIALLCQTPVVEVAPEPIAPQPVAVVTEEAIDEKFQFEALIEQLRSEKQDFADKLKESKKLFSAISTHYKDKLEITPPEQMDSMSNKDIAEVFKIEWPIKTT